MRQIPFSNENLGRFAARSSALALALALTACTTFGRKEERKDPDTLAAAARGETIVHQAGSKDPVVQKRDRQYWLDIRADAKSPVARMHATLATGEVRAAEDMARAYLRKHPGHLDAMTILAASLAMQKRYNLASYYASLIEQKSPDHPVALNIKGLSAMLSPGGRIQDYQRAMTYFQRAFEADGSQIAPGLNLGHLQLEIGDAAQAAQTFKSVAGRCGNCIPALMGYGIASSRTGKYETAVDAFESVLDKHKNHPGALFHLALVHKNGYRDHAKAEKYLNTLLTRSRTQDVALRERADVVLRQLKGESDPAERTQIAEGEVQGADDREDAELLMSTLSE